MNPTIRIARPCDDCRVGAAMRVRDAREVLAASGSAPVAALTRSREASIECYTIEHEGTPFAMFGVAPIAPGIASPWMLATDEFAQHTMFVLRHTRAFITRWLDLYPALVNYVDCRNKDSHVYLRAVGFRFTAFDPEYGIERRPFLQFMSTRNV